MKNGRKAHQESVLRKNNYNKLVVKAISDDIIYNHAFLHKGTYMKKLSFLFLIVLIAAPGCGLFSRKKNKDTASDVIYKKIEKTEVHGTKNSQDLDKEIDDLFTDLEIDEDFKNLPKK